LDYFQSQGYNEVDTARLYVGGKQEEWTAKAGWQERGLTLATKHYPSRPGDHKPDVLKATLSKSLDALQAKCVDIFYLHAADRSESSKESLIRYL
jgi:aflatoxin B1 aldehyde reductase